MSWTSDDQLYSPVQTKPDIIINIVIIVGSIGIC